MILNFLLAHTLRDQNQVKEEALSNTAESRTSRHFQLFQQDFILKTTLHLLF